MRWVRFVAIQCLVLKVLLTMGEGSAMESNSQVEMESLYTLTKP